MALREKVTAAMLQHAPIPEDKVFDEKHPYHYKNLSDNLYQVMGAQAQLSYSKGSGGEMVSTAKSPAKMASIASSSAMTYNLLGDGPAEIVRDTPLPMGFYQVQYEKQMYTLNMNSNPANLDAFLSNEQEKTSIFCEMKLLEWLEKPGELKDSYRSAKYYFPSDDTAVACPVDAYAAFRQVIDQIEGERFQRYDAWQMFKHLLAIYNHTSFTTQKAVDAKCRIPSMAGKYNRILLANVVNEFPPILVPEYEAYVTALEEEQDEAERFIQIIKSSQIPKLFDQNCHAGIEIIYISAEEFSDQLDMSPEKRAYLKRYFP